MSVRKLAFVFICVFSCLIGHRAYGQPGPKTNQSEPKTRVIIPNVDGVSEDLKWLIELSPKNDLKKQWKEVKDLIGAYTDGVDQSKPLLMEVVFHKDEISYDLRVPIDPKKFDANKKPIDNKKVFRDMLSGMGYKIKEIKKDVYYEFAEPKKKPSYLRFDKDYAWISAVKASIPENPPPAIEEAKALLELKKDVVAEIKNDADGIEPRRTTFKAQRTQLEAAVTFKRNEDPNAFELRKLALAQQLDELERFLVETDRLLVSWKTDAEAKTARGEIEITALSGTDLAKSIELFASKPSYFANIQLHKDPIAGVRMMLPIDSLRVGHLKEFYKRTRPLLETKIKGLPSPTTDDQKAAFKSASNIFIDLLETGISLGHVDGFLNAYGAESGNVVICGIRSANGKDADGIVELVPKMNPEWKVKMGVKEIGGVTIHELTVPKDHLQSFQETFPNETGFYVGTSKDAVWGAAGTDGLKHLEEAIDLVAKSAPDKPDPVALSYRVHVSKSQKILDLIRKEFVKDDAKHKKEIEKFNKLANDAMAGCEPLLTGELKRVDSKIEGFLDMNECLLRFVGSIIADTAKTMLQ